MMVIPKFLLRGFLAVILLSNSIKASGDTLTIFEAYRIAEQNFPLLNKGPLYDVELQLKMKNQESRYLPVINTIASITYQSDVVTLPFQIQGQEPLDLPRGRFHSYLDITQLIYDGGLTKISMDLERKETGLNKQRVKVSLQQLKEDVVNTFFSIVAHRQMDEILLNSKDLLLQKLVILQDALEGGILDQTGVLKLRAEILTLEQKAEEARQQTIGLIEILSILTGERIENNTEFIVPVELKVDINVEFRRPELDLLSLQQDKLNAMLQIHEVASRPKISAFGQGGLGYPNPYNFFNDEVSAFGIVGIRFSWNLWDWGKRQREQELLRLQSKIIESEKENAVQNLDIQAQTQLEKITELNIIMEKDLELIRFRQKILEVASLQLDEGIIGTGDYIEAVNGAQAAKLNMELHRIQLELAKANYLNLRGVFFDPTNDLK